jgi:hypothetical protein
MKANELARDLAVRTWTLIFAAILVPVLAGLIALILIPNGAPTCDMNAIGPENGMCRLPTDLPTLLRRLCLYLPTSSTMSHRE